MTLKNLIRTLHIRDPGYHVMAILGKTYPKSADEFSTLRLDGSWNEELAGKRMKLATAFTWETELSAKASTIVTRDGIVYISYII